MVNFSIGERVRLRHGKTGVVTFIGDAEFTDGEVVGVSLDAWIPHGHDGTVKGRKYFDAPSGRGYFTRRESISSIIRDVVCTL